MQGGRGKNRDAPGSGNSEAAHATHKKGRKKQWPNRRRLEQRNHRVLLPRPPSPTGRGDAAERNHTRRPGPRAPTTDRAARAHGTAAQRRRRQWRQQRRRRRGRCGRGAGRRWAEGSGRRRRRPSRWRHAATRRVGTRMGRGRVHLEPGDAGGGKLSLASRCALPAAEAGVPPPTTPVHARTHAPPRAPPPPQPPPPRLGGGVPVGQRTAEPAGLDAPSTPPQ